MPDDIQPILPLAEARKGVELKISGELPGEEFAGKCLDVYIRSRESMDPDIRRRWDLLIVQMAEDAAGVWRGLWKTWGVLQG